LSTAPDQRDPRPIVRRGFLDRSLRRAEFPFEKPQWQAGGCRHHGAFLQKAAPRDIETMGQFIRVSRRHGGNMGAVGAGWQNQSGPWPNFHATGKSALRSRGRITREPEGCGSPRSGLDRRVECEIGFSADRAPRFSRRRLDSAPVLTRCRARVSPVPDLHESLPPRFCVRFSPAALPPVCLPGDGGSREIR
jgi:hypothetical protein